jgi:hypothetical protein
MASNRLPQQLDRLFALAEDMADGLAAHETAVGIKQNKEADVRADLAAAAAAEADFQAKRRAKTVAVTAQTLAARQNRGGQVIKSPVDDLSKAATC